MRARRFRSFLHTVALFPASLLFAAACNPEFYAAPPEGGPVVLHDRGSALAFSPPQDEAGQGTHGHWSFSRRSKSTVTFSYRPAPKERPTHKLFFSTFATPTDHWDRFPPQQLFAEMIVDTEVHLMDILPDRTLDQRIVKSGLLVLTRPQATAPTVLTVGCTVPPLSPIALCGMLEELHRRDLQPPRSKAQLHDRMLEWNTRLVALLASAEQVVEAP